MEGAESILAVREEELAIVAQAERSARGERRIVASGGRRPRPAGRDRKPGHRRGQRGSACSAAVRLGRADRHGAAQSPQLGPDRLAVRRPQSGGAPDRALQQHACDRRRQPARAAARAGRSRRDRAHGRGAARLPRHRDRDRGDEPARAAGRPRHHRLWRPDPRPRAARAHVQPRLLRSLESFRGRAAGATGAARAPRVIWRPRAVRGARCRMGQLCRAADCRGPRSRQSAAGMVPDRRAGAAIRGGARCPTAVGC